MLSAASFHRAGGRSFCSSHPCATRFWKAGWRSRCGRRWTRHHLLRHRHVGGAGGTARIPDQLEFIGIDKDELQTKMERLAQREHRDAQKRACRIRLRAGPVRGGGDLYGLHPALPRLGAGAAAGGLSARQADRPAILRQANKLLGLAAGVVLALLRVWLFCAVVRLLLPCADTLGLDFVSRIDPSATFLFKFFLRKQLLQFLLCLSRRACRPAGRVSAPAAQTLD